MKGFFSPTIPADSSSLPQGRHETIQRLLLCSIPEARALISRAVAERECILILGRIELPGEEIVSAAVPYGQELQAQNLLRFITHRRVRVCGVEKTILSEAIARAYAMDEERLRESAAKLVEEQESVVPQINPLRCGTGDAAEFLADLIEYGFSKDASDVHLLPDGLGTKVRIRVNGELLAGSKRVGSRDSHTKLMGRLRVLAKLPPQDLHATVEGAFRVQFGGKNRSVRLSLIPTLHGEKAVLRLAQEASKTSLEELNFVPAVREIIEKFIQLPRGLFVVAGPTGSGKTSTLYSVIEQLAQKNLNVVTIEDPIERELSSVSQTSVMEAGNLTYANALRALLRQDPDIIMVGEIRDAESARIAFQAALSGHGVLTTVHARTLAEIAMRFSAFGVDWLTMSQGLTVLLSQQLLPLLCDACKVPDLESRSQSGREARLFRPVGCSKCGGRGFSTRQPVADAIWISEEARTALRSADPLFLSRKGVGPCREDQIQWLTEEGRLQRARDSWEGAR